MNNDEFDIHKLLNPQLLSNEQIRKILIARSVKTVDVENMARGELLDLFSRLAMPLEQRKLTRLLPETTTKEETSKGQSNSKSTSINLTTKKRLLNTYDRTELRTNDNVTEPNSKYCRLSNETVLNGEGVTKKRPINRNSNENEGSSQKRRKHELITWP